MFVYGRPVSMHLSYDGWYVLAKHTLQQDPLSGNLFAFINRRANLIKALYCDLGRSPPDDAVLLSDGYTSYFSYAKQV